MGLFTGYIIYRAGKRKGARKGARKAARRAANDCDSYGSELCSSCDELPLDQYSCDWCGFCPYCCDC